MKHSPTKWICLLMLPVVERAVVVLRCWSIVPADSRSNLFVAVSRARLRCGHAATRNNCSARVLHLQYFSNFHLLTVIAFILLFAAGRWRCSCCVGANLLYRMGQKRWAHVHGIPCTEQLIWQLFSMAHSDCGWTCGCAGKTVRSLENTCHTWALLRWCFTTKRRYIKCMHFYLYL